MRYTRVTGIVIKRADAGEADRLVTLFTREMGKITLKAKGVRKLTSKRAPHLELLTEVSCVIYAPRTGVMATATEVIPSSTWQGIKTNLTKIGVAYHICELIDSLCPQLQELPEVYPLLKNILDAIHRGGSIGRAVHAFEIALLTVLGFSDTQTLQGERASLFIESVIEKKLKSRYILPDLV